MSMFFKNHGGSPRVGSDISDITTALKVSGLAQHQSALVLLPLEQQLQPLVPVSHFKPPHEDGFMSWGQGWGCTSAGIQRIAMEANAGEQETEHGPSLRKKNRKSGPRVKKNRSQMTIFSDNVAPVYSLIHINYYANIHIRMVKQRDVTLCCWVQPWHIP